MSNDWPDTRPYNPTDVMAFEGPSKTAHRWRIFARTMGRETSLHYKPGEIDLEWLSLRASNEPMFMTREHAYLLWKNLGEVLRDMRTCLHCGRQWEFPDSQCHCENDE